MAFGRVDAGQLHPRPCDSRPSEAQLNRRIVETRLTEQRGPARPDRVSRAPCSVDSTLLPATFANKLVPMIGELIGGRLCDLCEQESPVTRVL